MEYEVATLFFAVVREQATGLMSSEHFSVDGTLIEAWASLKSFRPKDSNDGDNNGWGDFRGEQRRNAKLCFAAHALMENRNGLLVDLAVSQANGTSERETALLMLDEHVAAGATVGADRGYDTRDFVRNCRDNGVTPHVAQHQNEHRSSAIDGRTTRHVGYRISQTIRKRIEQIFGRIKSVGGLRRTRYRGRPRTQLAAYLVGAAYNLLRVAKLQRSAA
jgi:IS5 family transposase